MSAADLSREKVLTMSMLAWKLKLHHPCLSLDVPLLCSEAEGGERGSLSSSTYSSTDSLERSDGGTVVNYETERAMFNAAFFLFSSARKIGKDRRRVCIDCRCSSVEWRNRARRMHANGTLVGTFARRRQDPFLNNLVSKLGVRYKPLPTAEQRYEHSYM